jgi:hypothetical protein
MPQQNGEPTSEDNYQSSDRDKRLAHVLGITYVIIAIFLAWMLFKIWPPTPWPTDKALDQNPQLVKNLADCECPTPTPTATPTATPQQSPNSAGANSQAGNNGATPVPTATRTPTATVTPPPKNTGATSQGAGADQSKTQNPSPTVTPSPTPTPTDTLVNLPINFFWGRWCWRTSFDERLILLVIIAGILGSFVHGATSLADFIGNNKFNKNWSWFYLLRPVIGMSLALVFYFVVRGGFLTTSGGAKDINPYGIAALAGLVGMFSKQATDKLSEVFSTLFRAAAGEGDDKRKGSLNPDGKAITISGVDPKSVPPGNADLAITISGTNFVAGCKVLLNDVALATTFESVTKVTAKIPAANLAAPGTMKLKVVNPDGTTSAPVDFAVKNP